MRDACALTGYVDDYIALLCSVVIVDTKTQLVAMGIPPFLFPNGCPTKKKTNEESLESSIS